MPVDIRRPLKKYLSHLTAARDANLNEADTSQRLIKVFEDVLGYDPMREITREMQVKDKYVDIAIKVDDRIRLLIEVKAAGVELRDRHIEQAERYAAENNIPWVLLTNGVTWNLYHLTFDEGIDYERAFSVDISTTPIERLCECIGLLHRTSIRKNEHETFWEHRKALSAASIAKSLFTEEALRLLRRDIRRREGMLVDEEDLAAAIHGMFSVEAREQIGPYKIRRRRSVKKKAAAAFAVAAGAGLAAAAFAEDKGEGD
jgi:predicted type IV restriction endonuclease